MLGDRALWILLLTQDLVLPEGVVGVLDGQGLPGWGLALEACGVGGGEVAGEGAYGPAVACDVVEEEQEYVLVVGEAEERGADGDLAGQVEPVTGAALQVLTEVGFLDLEHRYVACRVCRRQDDLVPVVAVVGDESTEAFVA